MTDVVLACRDLMTASRLSLPTAEVRRCGREEQVRGELEQYPEAVVIVDLGAFPSLPEQVRTWGFRGRMVGFAPHVERELLEAARPWCDEVVPRGSVVKHFARYAGIDSRAPEKDSP